MSAKKPHDPTEEQFSKNFQIDLLLDKDATARAKFINHEFSVKWQYHLWRHFLIPLMVIVPWLLFWLVWIILMSEPVVFCSEMDMCKDPALWTKNIFVSGFFVTLVSFYTVLAKGLLGDKDKDKSLAERASAAALAASNSSGG